MVASRRYANKHPKPRDVLLVVEVSDSTLRYDREIKVPLYARCGIPEVWLVDLENRIFHVFRTPQESGYRECHTYREVGVIMPVRFPQHNVDLSGLF